MGGEENCPFCKLTPAGVEALSEEEARHLYFSGGDGWCLNHMVISVTVRKMTGATGKSLIKKIVEASGE